MITPDMIGLFVQLGVGAFGMWLMYKIVKEEIHELRKDTKETNAKICELLGKCKRC